MPNPSATTLRPRIDQFVTDLTALIRSSALEAVEAALGGTAPLKRGLGRPPKAAPATRSGKRAKRAPAAVMAMAARIHAALKARSGQSASELATELRIPLAALKLPMAKLLKSRVVTTQGQRRGTRYHAAGGRSPAAARAPVARRAAPKAAKAAPRKRKPISAEQKAPASLVPALVAAPRDYEGERMARMRAERAKAKAT
jgi:hypothetical protein